MTTLLPANSSPSLGSIRLTMAGLFGMAVFGVVVAATQDSIEWLFVAVTVGVALVLATWLWKRRSRAALVTTLVLGGLQFLEQVAYSVADLSNTGAAVHSPTLADLFGALVSGAVVAGAASGLWQRRRALPA